MPGQNEKNQKLEATTENVPGIPFLDDNLEYLQKIRCAWECQPREENGVITFAKEPVLNRQSVILAFRIPFRRHEESERQRCPESEIRSEASGRYHPAIPLATILSNPKSLNNLKIRPPFDRKVNMTRLPTMEIGCIALEQG